MKYKVEIWYSYNGIIDRMAFKTIIELPFVPFIGMWVTWTHENGDDYNINFKPQDKKDVSISWDLTNEMFVVDIQDYTYSQGMDQESREYIIDTHKTWEQYR